MLKISMMKVLMFWFLMNRYILKRIEIEAVTPFPHLLESKATALPLGAKDSSFLRNKFSNNFKSENSPTRVPVQPPSQSLMVCETSGSCRSNREKDVPSCYCDDECVVLNDCCHDFNQTLANDSIFSAEIRSKLGNMTCTTHLFGTKYTNAFGAMLISECPLSYRNDDVMHKCTSLHAPFPVTDPEGVSYKNVYCALCHGVTEYTVWTLVFSYGKACADYTTEFTDIKNMAQKISYIVENKCDYWYIPPDNTRFCIKSHSSEENGTENKLCSAYQNPVSIRDREGRKHIYRNYHCRTDTTETRYICAEFELANIGTKGYADTAMTGIFNIRPPVEANGHGKCQDNEIFSEHSGVCVKTECTKKHTDCTMEQIKNYKIGSETLLSFTTSGTINLAFVTRIAAIWFSSLPVEFYQMDMVNLNILYQCGHYNGTFQRTCCISQNVVEMKIRSRQTIKVLEQLVSDLESMEWFYSEERNQSLVKSRIQDSDHKVLSECIVTGKRVKSFMGLQKFHKYVETIALYTSNITDSVKAVPKSVESYYIVDEHTENIIRIVDWNITYNEKNVSDAVINSNTIWPIKSILTYVTLSISSICLVMTISVYKYLDWSTFSAGAISLNMMAVLLIAQLIFIFAVGAVDKFVFCYVIGITSHYSWLSAFSWNSVFLVDVLQMMIQLYRCPAYFSQSRKIPVYIYIMGYGLPILVVVPSILVDQFTNIHIGYTGSICFPTGYPANLYVVTIPIALSITLNVVFLTVFAILLSRYNITTIVYSSNLQNTKSHIPLFIRMGLLTAFPWIFGIIADLLNSEILKFLYIILAGSHGTLVSFVFLSGKSVRSEFKRKRINSSTKSNDFDLFQSRRDSNIQT